jgi:PKD repeat protein
VFLEFGIKAIGFELITLKTSSITRTIIGSPSRIAIGDYNAVLMASFTFSPVEPTAADDVKFTDTSSDDDGNIVAWGWNFGDGTTSIERNPSHKFKEGSYTITLTVTDDKGAKDSTSKLVSVKAHPA